MTDSSEDYRKTAVLYCNDLIDQIRDRTDFIAEARTLDAIVEQALDSPDVPLLRDIARVMGTVHEKAMRLYARYPQSVFLENIIARSDSIRRILIESIE